VDRRVGVARLGSDRLMPYRLIEDDPDPGHVRRMTFVPFLPDGRCLVLPGPALPSGVVAPGETWPVEDLAARLPVVRDAAESFRTQSDESYYADNLRVMEPAYLRIAVGSPRVTELGCGAPADSPPLARSSARGASIATNAG